jgi:hypothetical protein
MEAVSCRCSGKNADNSDMKSNELRYLRWSSFSPAKGQEHNLLTAAGTHSIGENKRNLNQIIHVFLFHFGTNNANCCYWFQRCKAVALCLRVHRNPAK